MGLSSAAREERRLLVRESWDSLILGAFSISVGVVVLIAMATGRVGLSPPGWTEPTIAGRAGDLIPKGSLGVAAMIGEFLGLAGIWLARSRHGAISPLSILGTVICLSHFVLFFCGSR